MQLQTNNFRTENFFSIASEDELVRSFRLRDQKKLVLPQNLEFPMNIRSYLSWREPSGVYTYLVYKAPNWDLPKGVALKRSSAKNEHGGLCSWCHSYGTAEEIGMYSVKMDPDVSCSYILCQDIRCAEKIEETSNLAGKNPEPYFENLYYRIGKLFENLSGYRRE